MEYTKIRSPFQLDITNSPLDARIVVLSEADIMNIAMPYVGMAVYCINTGQRYTITELDSEVIIEGVLEVPDKKVKTYKLDATTINYRGEYTVTTPDNPVPGDWFRNTIEGAAYIYQNNEWVLMAKDGEVGPQGIPGQIGPSGSGIVVKGVLDNVNDLPSAADSKLGDAYIINGHLWVFAKDGQWYDAGTFRGEGNFIDVRYSNDLTTKEFVEVGVYIGILVTETKLQEPADFDSYTWSELAGTSSISIYKHVSKNQTPTPPQGNTLEEVAAEGWTRDPDAAPTGTYTWMSTAEFKNATKLNNWTKPIRITGLDGEKGIDGTDIQFAYKLWNSNTNLPEYNSVAKQEDDYYMVDYGWTNNASGVSKDNKYEWMSVRYRQYDNGSYGWTAYSKPVIWATFGEDGVDGGCVEYIYSRTEAHNAELLTYTPAEWQSMLGYNDYDWYPEEDGWTDNPIGVDTNLICEWVSTRKATPGDDGKLVWGPFSTPSLWSKYAKDGISPLTIILSNDNAFIICNTDGIEVNANNRPSTQISVFLGDANVTDKSSLVATCSIEGIEPKITQDGLLTFDIAENTVLTDPFVISIEAAHDDYVGIKKFVVNPINNPNYEYYELNLNTHIVRRDKDGNEYPQRIVAEIYKYNADGKTSVTVGDGLFIHYDLDDKGSLMQYINSVDCGAFLNIVTFYLKDSNGNQLDQQSVEVISDGTDGTSISISDTVPTLSELLAIDWAAPGTVMYCEETGHLYMWDGKEWKDCGEIKGEPGEKAYMHIKYADEYDPETGEYTFTAENGEVPGRYMGTYADNTPDDSDKWLDYKWYEIQGKPGKNGAKTVSIYIKSSTVPEAPTSTNIPDSTESDWSTIMPELTVDEIANGLAIYMCVGVATDGVEDTTVDGNGWQGPVRITGEKGEAGEDGTNIQYIYRLTDTRPTLSTTGQYDKVPNLPTYDYDSEDYQNDNWLSGDTVIDGWTNHPQGIDENNPTEWMSYRTKTDKIWSALSEPIPWSVYGNTGMDGDGVEYIYLRTDVEDAPPVPQLTDEEEVPAGWSDNPTGVDANNPYEWVCTRRRKDGVWGDFTGSASNPGYASLWAAYGLKGDAGATVMYINTWRAVGVTPDQPIGGNIPSSVVTAPLSWSTSSEILTVEYYEDLLDISAIDGEMRFVEETGKAYQYVDDNSDWLAVEKYHTWVSSAVIDRSVGTYSWDVPFRITGDDGQPGTDGSNIEFVYHSGSAKYDGEWTPAIITPDDYLSNATYQVDEYLPYSDQDTGTKWTDTPAAVSENVKTVYISSRKKPHLIEQADGSFLKVNKWGPFEKPKPWAVWGEKGQDGDGVNYVYFRSKWLDDTAELNNAHLALKTWAENEKEEGQTNGEKISAAAVNVGWKDHPQGVTEEYPYEYVSSRKQVQGVWSLTEYSEPKLWSRYSKDGEDGLDGNDGRGAFYVDLNDQMSSVPCAADGALLTGSHVGALNTKQYTSEQINYNDLTGSVLMWNVEQTDGVEIDYLDPLTKSYRIILYVDGYGELTFELAELVFGFLRWTGKESYDVNSDWATTGIITFNSFPRSGWFELTLEDYDGNLYDFAIPVGNFSDNSRFQTPILLRGISLVGNRQLTLTDGVTYGLNADGLIASNFTDTDGSANISIYGFENQSVSTGKLTLVSTYDDTLVHTTYTLAKAYSGLDGKDGSGAEFEILQLRPKASTIQLTTDSTHTTISDVYPGILQALVSKTTLDGVSMSSKVPTGYELRIYTYYCGNAKDSVGNMYENKEYERHDVITADVAYISLDISEYLEYTEDDEIYTQIPRYFELSLYRIGAETPIDFERIPFVATIELPEAQVPDWVTEWDGQTAELNGDKVLAGKIYAGEAPVQTTGDDTWAGVLIGNEVAQIKNLPWEPWVDSDEAHPFTGIIGLTGVTIDSDLKFNAPNYANVSFALDALTGNSYFSGIAYDAKIDSCDITDCVISNLRIVANLEYGQDDENLLFGNGTINIFTKSPVYDHNGDVRVDSADNIVYQKIFTLIGYDQTDQYSLPSLRTMWYEPEEDLVGTDDEYNPFFISNRKVAIDMGCDLNGVTPYFKMITQPNAHSYSHILFPTEITQIIERYGGETSHILMDGFNQVFSLNGNTFFAAPFGHWTTHQNDECGYNPYTIDDNCWGTTWVNPSGISVTRNINYDDGSGFYNEGVIKIGQFCLQNTNTGSLQKAFNGLFMDVFFGDDSTHCAVVLPGLAKYWADYNGWVYSCSYSDLASSNRDDIQVLCIVRK